MHEPTNLEMTRLLRSSRKHPRSEREDSQDADEDAMRGLFYNFERSDVARAILPPTLGPERCLHKIETTCHLTQVHVCCACADKRPRGAAYAKYVDGVGDTVIGSRVYGYCPGCKVHWEEQCKRRDSFDLADIPVSLSPSRVVIINSSAHHSLKLVVSDDLTIGALRLEMARLLSCEASEIILESEGLVLCADSSRFGTDEVSSRMKVIYCRQRFNLGARNHYMEDILENEGDLGVLREDAQSKRRRLK
ncbi:hypothetical protein BDV96DRAFT_376447 [Lophiotrema nucula]|uniref:Uncharacterized protein n=1 Tax=Lophiotrema nucula TaxID=690887 RepID=A0A6A5YGC5_9PLEO|nr:hypothetical protein BDV96DRAFT_376447 [Lophiotrema nucula]